MYKRREHLPKEFGLTPAKRLPKRQKEKSTQINGLFDEMKNEYDWESRAVFHAAVDELHSRFLHDVRSCPDFVLAYCQRQLAPDALAAHRSQKEATRQVSVTNLKKELEKLEKAAP